MATSVIDHLAKGTFAFLRSNADELRQTMPHWQDLLPEPQTIFLEDESLPPIVGFPVLLSRSLGKLSELLAEYIRLEEEMQIAGHARQAFDSRAYAAGWENYRSLLAQLIENATISSQGLDYISLFWLNHSLHLSKCVLDIPKRVRRKDLAIGRDHGDSIKYRVLAKWIDRVRGLTEEISHKVASEMREDHKSLVPPILGYMCSNVLILTESHISRDLSELSSYFQGHLKIDGRAFRLKLKNTVDWLTNRFESDPLMRSAITELLGEKGIDPGRIACQPGFLRFASRFPGYSPEQFLGEAELQHWAKLAQALREFEILHSLRRMIVPLEVESGQYISRDRSFNSTWVGGPPVLRLSPATRPIDFSAQWVVNPIVQRFGLIYDITDFSAILSMLGRSEKKALDDAFRMTSSFQRQINYMAAELNLRLEKYLGDGAFYSGRHPRKLLAMAIQLQRLYPEFVAHGFPFKAGLRIAMNYGEYRLLPLQEGPNSTRYEFFGHGLVELSRLSTGKKTQEIGEFRNYLIAQGYPELQVNKFFAPMMRRDSELVSKIDESRQFFAYINQNHTLINEGIVATEPFITRLGSFSSLYYARDQGRGFIGFRLRPEEPTSMIGVRKLGIGRFKGLEPMPVYEVVDGATWSSQDYKEIPAQRLLGALERLFAKTVAASQQKSDQTPSADIGQEL